MLRTAYQLIKNRLLSEVPNLKHVDWDLQQDSEVGDTSIKDTPLALISFLPISWSSETQKLQRADLSFRIRLITQTRYGDERDMLESDIINHLGMEEQIFKSLHGHTGLLSDLVDDPDPDAAILSNMYRTSYQPHDRIDNLIRTWQAFTCEFCDVSAMKQYQKVFAEIVMQFEIVKDMSLEVQ